MQKIILASASPRRKEILQEIGINFEVVPSNFEEDNTLYTDPYELVQRFCVAKAKEVLVRHPDAIVIGSDVVGLDPKGQIVGKAKDKNQAFQIIKSIQGRWIKVIAGVAVLSRDKEQVGYDEATVYFRPMTDIEIKDYVEDEQADWHDAAGAFKIQGRAGKWIDRYEGEYEVVLGMPKKLTNKYLREFGVEI
jgi:septum formation protein